MNLKKLFHILQKVSPYLAAKLAFYFTSKPIYKKIRPFEKKIIESSDSSTILYKNRKIKTYKWGTGNKKAFLIHGWGGRASNFGAVISELINHDYEVFSFDAPAHGESSGSTANFFEISDLVKFFLEKENYDLIISHSMGSTFAFTAMNGLKYQLNKMIVLTSPYQFLEFVNFAKKQFGLTEKTTQLMIDRIQALTTEYNPSTLSVKTLSTPINIKKMVLIHDKNDKIISIEKTKMVSSLFENSLFFEIEGTGHYKMLWSEKVISIVEHHILNS